MDKFDEDLAAKEAIATSPEVTEGAQQISAALEAEKALPQAPQAVNTEPNAWDKRNARLLTKSLRQLSQGNGGELDDDQLSAIEDLSAEGFGILSALNAPKAVKIGITAALVAVPFIPIALSVRGIFKNTQEEVAPDGIG
jgi:hypothetical protein